MTALTVVTPPAEELLSLAEAKLQCRVDGTADDVLLDGLITSIRQHLDAPDGYMNRALLTQTFALRMDAFPAHGCAIELLAPLQAVTSVTYVDTAGATQTLAPTEYQVDSKREPGRIAPAYGKSWPSTRCQFGAVTVTYKAGYASADLVPGPIKSALLLMVASLYANREAPLVMTPAIEALLAPYRVWL